MSRSEIDDIFAASAPPKKKTKTSLSQTPTNSHHPETIPDPSKRQVPYKRRRDPPLVRPSFLLLPSSQSPPGRKTADGYNIYKEDELGISTTGGGDHLIQSLALF
ncbi:hypothetical protein HD554DRAFT_2167850 [Boletus coccyginus]|nr:hypothetical protein HD554DRAFT_2167850 [Boletus coccyginus]